MWKKLYFIFLILLFIFYVYFGMSVSLYEKNTLKEEIVNKEKLVGIINNEDKTEDITSDNFKEEKTDIIGYIKIEKIKLIKKLYDINSMENTVEKNIQILDSSSMPDIDGGNFILAAHSGFSSIAYFHNLYKLEIGDGIDIIYDNKNYKYIVDNIYVVPKTGKIPIKRDQAKTTITLTTCFSDDQQLVIIGYLI